MTDKASEHMSKKLTTVRESESIEQALMVMKNHHFRHLPVTTEKTGEIIGIVSDRDLYKALSSDEVSVGQVMSHPVMKFDVSVSVNEIVDSMVKNKVSAFLLTKESEVKGIITTEDLLIMLSNMLTDEAKQKTFDNYLEYTNQLTGANFNPNLIF